MKLLKPVAVGLRPYLLRILLPAAGIFIGALWGLQQVGISPDQALRDPAQQSGASSLIGFISHLGIWCWVAAASLALFLRASTDNKALKEQFLLMGILSFSLAADDLFMLHERFLGQKLCFTFYAGCALLLTLRHGKRLWKHQGAGLFFTGILLIGSIGIDLVQERFPESWGIFRLTVEDGFKFLGSCSWLYVIFKAGQFLRKREQTTS